MDAPGSTKAVVDFFVSVGVTSAIIGGAVSWIANVFLAEKIKARIKSEYDEKLENLKALLKSQYDEKLETHKAQLKAQGDVEIEKLKSGLSVAAAQNTFQFSKLHEKRAEVIADVYSALREAIFCLSDYTKAFESVGGESRDERRKKAVEAVNTFTKLYSRSRIFIPAEAASKLDAMNLELKSAYHRFAFGVDLIKDQGAEQMKTWLGVNQKIEVLSKDVLQKLEQDFRALLGDVVSSP